MNIITVIQTALTALNNDAELFLLEKPRAENEELNHTGDVIVVYPDWRTTNILNQGVELVKTRIYNIDFKTLDEWDNSDNNIPTSYESKTSISKIEDMETLADSVFSYITANSDLFPELRENLKWGAPEPILRQGNGTMSGVSVRLTIAFAGDVVCDYAATPFIVNYRNAVITNAVAGTIATINFEAKIDTDTDITFNVNWGVNIGTSIVKESFLTDVWKSLQSKIFIPLDADINQLMEISDNFGGELRFNYIVESATLIIKDGNTVGWYIADDLTTITKDASNFMSEFRDVLGSGHDLLQAVGSFQFKWTIDGVFSDGIDNFMKTVAFTFDQPEQIYIVFKQITWTSNDTIAGGLIPNVASIRQRGTSPIIQAYAGIWSLSNADLTLDNFGIIRILFNGINSSSQINASVKITGDAGTANAGGFTLGARGGGTAFYSHIQVKEIILRNIADTAQNEQAIYNYLSTKYSI